MRNYRDYIEQGRTFHIYNKVVSSISLFRDEADYLDFMFRYEKYLDPYFDTFAYSLMPNHFHFLVRVKEDIDEFVKLENTTASINFLNGEFTFNDFIENQFSRMFSGITLKYNRKYTRQGPLFKEGIKRVEIKFDHRVIYQVCYIHHNCIHHGLSNNYHGWKYSSFKAFSTSINTKIKTDEILTLFGGISGFQELHNNFKLQKKEENIFLDKANDH